MSVWRVTLTLALGVVLPMPVAAQDSPSPALSRATTQPAPLFPSRELDRGREGWVLVDFTVSDEGIVEDARIRDSSGSKAFDEAALDSVRDWHFERVPGKAGSSVLVNFEFERVYPQLGRRFLIRYKKAHELIDQGELEKAQDLVDRMQHDSRLTAFELAYSNIAAGRIAAERGNRAEQLRYFRRAMLNEGRWVENSAYLHLLYAAVVIEIQEEDFASALRDHALLAETAAGREIAADLEEPIRRLRSMVGGDNGATRPFRVADRIVTVTRERPGSEASSSRPRDYPDRGIEEREFQRMKEFQEQN